MSQMKKVLLLGPNSGVFRHICRIVASECSLHGFGPHKAIQEHLKNNPKNGKGRYELSNDVLTNIILEYAKKHDRCLIYGIPKDVENTKKLFSVIKLDAFIHLSIDYNYTIKDLDERYTHLPTGRRFHMKYKIPPPEFMKDFNNAGVFAKSPPVDFATYDTTFYNSVDLNNAVYDHIAGLTKTLKIENAEDYESTIPKIVDFINKE